MIVYDRLWETLQKKNISQYKLIHTYGISPSQLTRLKRNQSVSTHTIDTFCQILNCDITDIMSYVKTPTGRSATKKSNQLHQHP